MAVSLAVFCWAKLGLAHEGHGMPGALPPPPHGGVVQEALHQAAHNHAGSAEEVELFFEATYRDKELKIYPLALLPNKTNSFAALSPAELSKLSVKLEYPRTKKTEAVSFKVVGDSLVANVDPKGANRFIVHIAADHAKEAKVAKVQLENR